MRDLRLLVCGVAIVSDEWAGLETFFQPGVEIIVARNTDDVMAAMKLSEAELSSIAKAGRQRVLESHTAAHRAAELEKVFSSVRGMPAIESFYQRQMVAEV